jgi:hypothetical protein
MDFIKMIFKNSVPVSQTTPASTLQKRVDFDAV